MPSVIFLIEEESNLQIFSAKCKAACATQETSLLMEEFYDQFIKVLNNLISQELQPTFYSMLLYPHLMCL